MKKVLEEEGFDFADFQESFRNVLKDEKFTDELENEVGMWIRNNVGEKDLGSLVEKADNLFKEFEKYKGIEGYFDVTVKQMFLDVADEDYFLAQISYCYELGYPFIWNASQALEKYIKCILLYNRCKNVSTHSLCELCKKVESKLEGNFRKFGREFSISIEIKNFLKMLDLDNQGGNVRYSTYRYDVVPGYLKMLRYAVGYMRGYCQPFCDEFTHFPEELALSPSLEMGKKYTIRAGKKDIIGGRLERLKDYEVNLGGVRLKGDYFLSFSEKKYFSMSKTPHYENLFLYEGLHNEEFEKLMEVLKNLKVITNKGYEVVFLIYMFEILIRKLNEFNSNEQLPEVEDLRCELVLVRKRSDFFIGLSSSETKEISKKISKVRQDIQRFVMNWKIVDILVDSKEKRKFLDQLRDIMTRISQLK